MQSIKNALISAPVLVIPKPTGHLTLDTDACDVQGDYILLQKQSDDTFKQIRYWS